MRDMGGAMRTMRSILFAAFGCAVIWGCSPQPQHDSFPSVVRLGDGVLRGFVSRNVVEFRGVPYASPPVGERRFAPPAPVPAWQGQRDATRFASPCPQAQQANEDCLYLNIVRPRASTGGKLPVMVWLHGGGFSAGTPNTYDPSELAVKGDVIVVGVAFRLNVFGLLALPGMEGAGSLYLQDQQAALRWIRRNIARFGGDPRNVTLFGESGGAIGICGQLTSPGAGGLFDKAILQSGSCSTRFERDFVARGAPAGGYYAPLAVMVAQGKEWAASVGCAQYDGSARLACLRRLPATLVARSGGPFISASFGTPTLPVAPETAVRDGHAMQIPILTGFTSDEGLAMVAGMQLVGAPVSPGDYHDMVVGAFGRDAPSVLAAYPLAAHAGRGDLAWAAIITDRMFACPQLRDARALARRRPVFVYEFADTQGAGLVPTPPGLPRGAPHTSDLPLLFRLRDGPLDIATGRKIERSAAQQDLSSRMIAAWTRFARSGRPDGNGAATWRRFRIGDHAIMRLAPVGVPGPALDPTTTHHCTLWDAIAERKRR